jgi:hypothetical protein
MYQPQKSLKSAGKRTILLEFDSLFLPEAFRVYKECKGVDCLDFAFAVRFFEQGGIRCRWRCCMERKTGKRCLRLIKTGYSDVAQGEKQVEVVRNVDAFLFITYTLNRHDEWDDSVGEGEEEYRGEPVSVLSSVQRSCAWLFSLLSFESLFLSW